MSYRHKVIFSPPEKDEKLGALASEAAAMVAGLSYTPRVVFFEEDNVNGRYERDIRCAGFIDYYLHPTQLSVFIRSGLPPRETTRVIFHELGHIADFTTRKPLTGADANAIREARAHDFEFNAPIVEGYSDIVGELSSKLTKIYIKQKDVIKARRCHEIWKAVDAAGAAKIDDDDLLTDRERRLKIKIEAEEVRAETERNVKLRETKREFEKWLDDLRSSSRW